MSNEDTLIVVHAYAGDAHQVEYALPQYLHHDCPVLILSPKDAPVQIDHPRVECRSAGKRAYTGQTSLDRQRAHLRILQEYPQRFFLLHDSDSVCLSPDLSRYEGETVFYNASRTERFLGEKLGYSPEFDALHHDFPVVFQPPLFFSRDSLDRMLACSDQAMARLPRFARLIDWYFAAMAQEAGLETRAFPDGISRPIWALYEAARVYAMVRTRGVTMLHSVKDPEILEVLIAGHAEWNADPAGDGLCDFL